MRIDEITKFFDDIETIDIEKEVTKKLFKTDSNGNPIIGQYISGYEGINFQNLVAKARAAAQAKPREERKAIDDLVDAEIQKHLNKKKKEQQPKKDQKPAAPPVSKPAPIKPSKEKSKKVKPRAKPQAMPQSSDSDDSEGTKLKGKLGDLQDYLSKHIKPGIKFADKYTKGV